MTALEIAGKLTEAQRAALIDVIDLGWAILTKGGTGRSAKALHRRGLTNLAWAPSSLTPLGLEVRSLLKDNSDANG